MFDSEERLAPPPGSAGRPLVGTPNILDPLGEELPADLHQRLAKYTCPAAIEFSDSLPSLSLQVLA